MTLMRKILFLTLSLLVTIILAQSAIVFALEGDFVIHAIWNCAIVLINVSNNISRDEVLEVDRKSVV